MSQTSYQIENAKSGRAACKKCKEKISKGELRIGVFSPGPNDVMMTRWFHTECFTLPRKLVSGGFDASRFVQEMLEDSTDDLNLEDIEDQIVEAIETKPVVTKKPKEQEHEEVVGGTSVKEMIRTIKEHWESIYKKEEEEEKEEEPVTKKKRSKVKKEEDEEDEKPARKKMKGDHGKKVKKEEDDEGGLSRKVKKEEEEEDEKPARKMKKEYGKKVKKEEDDEGGLSSEEKRLAAVYNIYAGQKNDELKDILRWNKQLVSGTRDILLHRVIDGHMDGRLGSCPSCTKGRLKLSDEDAEKVMCSGWFDEENMVRHSCFYSCSRDEAPRFLPWFKEEPNVKLEEIDKENKIKQEQTETQNDPTSKLQSLASELPWDLGKPSGIKKAAKDMLRICTDQLDLPDDETKARMGIGKIVLANKNKTATEIILLLIEKFGLKQQKEEAKQRQADTIASICKHPSNASIMMAIMELSDLYFKEGNKNAGATYKKVATAIQNLEFEITEKNAKGLGKGKTKVANIGKGSADKIHEFVTTGRMEKLEEKRKGNA